MTTGGQLTLRNVCPDYVRKGDTQADNSSVFHVTWLCAIRSLVEVNRNIFKLNVSPRLVDFVKVC